MKVYDIHVYVYCHLAQLLALVLACQYMKIAIDIISRLLYILFFGAASEKCKYICARCGQHYHWLNEMCTSWVSNTLWRKTVHVLINSHKI